MLPDAVAFALLGAIESLLSAVVADGMTGRRHRSNCELVAQGVANIGASLFGGICATGTIARTATNVRAGARGPVAGMMHAVFLLLFMLLAAPLAAYIPLAALAGVLAVVAWNMAEKHEFLDPAAQLARRRGGPAGDLPADGVPRPHRRHRRRLRAGRRAVHPAHGAAPPASRRMPPVGADAADMPAADALRSASSRPTSEVVVYRLSGAFFFGTASILNAVLDRIGDRHKAFVVDFSAVPFVDSTAANVIAAHRPQGRPPQGAGVRHRRHARGAPRAARRRVRRRPQVRYRRHIEDAVREAPHRYSAQMP